MTNFALFFIAMGCTFIAGVLIERGRIRKMRVARRVNSVIGTDKKFKSMTEKELRTFYSAVRIKAKGLGYQSLPTGKAGADIIFTVWENWE